MKTAKRALVVVSIGALALVLGYGHVRFSQWAWSYCSCEGTEK